MEYELSGTNNPAYKKLDYFTQGYIQAMFFADIDHPDSDTYGLGFDDLASTTLKQIVADCVKFQELAGDMLNQAVETSPSGRDMESAGMDFYYTRQGHGTGFWECGDSPNDRWSKECGEALTALADQFPEISPYASDNGKIYL